MARGPDPVGAGVSPAPSLVLLAVAALCVALAAGSRAAARDRRPELDTAMPSLSPAPEGLRIASLGHGSAAASALWMRTVTRFVTALYERDDPEAPAWIADAVRSAGALDPEWLVPWVYGAMMLERLDEVPLREELLVSAIEAHPEEPYFPFVLGMSRYHRGDLADALGWLQRAADTPGADPAYGRALRTMRARAGEAP